MPEAQPGKIGHHLTPNDPSMRSHQTITISLPADMIDQVEKVRKAEHRTRSELVREALRAYFSDHFAEASVSAAELRAIRCGRAQIGRGEYVTLDELFNDLESKNRQASKKRA